MDRQWVCSHGLVLVDANGRTGWCPTSFKQGPTFVVTTRRRLLPAGTESATSSVFHPSFLADPERKTKQPQKRGGHDRRPTDLSRQAADGTRLNNASELETTAGPSSLASWPNTKVKKKVVFIWVHCVIGALLHGWPSASLLIQARDGQFPF